MNFKLLLAFVFAALATSTAAAMENFFNQAEFSDAAAGETGSGCCLPDQWEARVGALVLYSYKRRGCRVKASDFQVGFDYPGQKAAVRTYVPYRRHGRLMEVRAVADFSAKKVYYVFMNRCRSFSLKREMPQPCLPDFFKRFASYSYGAGNDSLSLTPYGYRRRGLSVFAVVTEASCSPLKFVFNHVRGCCYHKMGSYQFYNVTLGVKDNSLYSVPDFCKRSRFAPGSHGLLNKAKSLFKSHKDDLKVHEEEKEFDEALKLASAAEGGKSLKQAVEFLVSSSQDLKAKANSLWKQMG